MFCKDSKNCDYFLGGIVLGVVLKYSDAVEVLRQSFLWGLIKVKEGHG